MGVSKVVYGNQTLIDISGDTVTPETLMNGYTAHDASGAAIVGNAPGGGGSGTSKNVMYDMGVYFGSASADEISSLPISTSGHIGNKAILIIIHRKDITLDSAWTFVDKKANPTDADHPYAQYVSIYEKIVTQSSESYTITQASADRLCACVYYFDSGATLSFRERIDMATTGSWSSYRSYYLGAYTKDTLCILSNVYVANNVPKISPNIAICTSGNIGSGSSRRMYAFVNPSLTEVCFYEPASKNNDSLFANKFFVFDINMPSRQGLLDKTITENGTYNPLDEGYEGYGDVTVNVPTGGDLSKYVTALDSYGEPIGVDDFSLQITNTSFNKAVVIGDNIINCANMFSGLGTFNNSVTFGNNVQSCYRMFYYCQNFNQPITLPDTVTYCPQMLYNAQKFNQPITIPKNVTHVYEMFYNDISYNKPVTFETTFIESAINMFNNCKAFNQPITLNVSDGTNISGMFNNCRALNQSVVFNGILHEANNVFMNCIAFNQPVSLNFNMTGSSYGYHPGAGRMFYNCTAFNSPVTINFMNDTGTDTVSFEYVFNNCISFNSQLTVSDWNRVTSTMEMFRNCRALNQTLGIDTLAVSGAYNMFLDCVSLNQDFTINFTYTYTPTVSNMFKNCLNVGGNFYFANGNSPSTTSMFNNAGTRRKNIFCNNLSRQLWTNAQSIVGQTITWTAMGNGQGYYNDSFNIYLYNQW